MNLFFEDIELFIVISLTLFAKWLMSEESPEEGETKVSKFLRRKRAYGGVIAGALCAYYGPQILMAYFEVFTIDLIIPMTIIMALSGEHIFRALITKLPTWIEMFVVKRINK